MLRGREKPKAEVWLSKDGLSWMRVPDNPAFDGATMSSVVAAGPGLIAAGNHFTNGMEPIADERGIIWVSTDGREWHRVAIAKTFWGASVDDLVKTPRGFIATGETYPSPSGSQAVVWLSPDGVHWKRVQSDGAFPDASSMGQIVAGPRGLLAVGVTEPPLAENYSLAWTSSDGAHWRRVSGNPFEFGLVSGIAAAGPGYLAAGQQDYDPVLWSSPDGVHWTRTADGTIFTGNETAVDEVLPWDANLLVVGFQSEQEFASISRPAVWLWTPGSTAVPAPLAPGLDPKALRLRQADLPRGYIADEESWLLICDLEDRPDPGGRCHRLLQALGSYHAYIFQFRNVGAGKGPLLIVGTVIVTPNAAHAVATMQNATTLLQPTPSPGPTVIPTQAHIGQGLKLSRVTMQLVSGQNLAEPATAAIWRAGRIVEMLEVAGTGSGAQRAVLRYARRLWQHVPRNA